VKDFLGSSTQILHDSLFLDIGHLAWPAQHLQ
jgi:hypothetical protein